MSNIQKVNSFQTGEHCWSEVASTGAVEVQLAACHVQPHSPRGISALLNVFAFLTLCCNDGPKLLNIVIYVEELTF